MYRRRVKKPPVPVFPDTLSELGYSINEHGQIIDSSGQQYEFDRKAKNREYQVARGRALTDSVMKIMVERMESELGLVNATVPLGIDKDDKTSPQANILHSPDVNECKRLLVLVPGTMESIGLWSRRILTKQDVKAGSMYSTVKTAREEGYGVMVLNPNAHFWVDGHSSIHIPVGKTYEGVPSLSSPEEHVDYVLRNFVQSFASREIYFIAHRYGAEALIQALHAQFNVFKDRVAGIAITEGTQSIDSFVDPAFKNWWNMNTVGYIQSSEKNKDEIEYVDHAGCNCVKTGTKEYDFTTIEAMPGIFLFFNSRKGRDNTFDNYKDVVRPQNADDPTTAIKTIHVDADDDIEWDTNATVEE